MGARGTFFLAPHELYWPCSAVRCSARQRGLLIIAMSSGRDLPAVCYRPVQLAVLRLRHKGCRGVGGVWSFFLESAAAKPFSTNRLRTSDTVFLLQCSIDAIASTDWHSWFASRKSNICACRILNALLLPFLTMFSSSCRSSGLSRTIYRCRSIDPPFLIYCSSGINSSTFSWF